jgi:signal transduction histidine kinase
MIITYILVSSIIATGAYAIGRAQRRERRRLVTMSQSATIPHRLETPVSEIAALSMELELRTLQLEAERIETDRLRAIVRETLR